MNQPIVIGLTGGIGSGKTLASDHFATLGVNIIDTDIIARNIVKPGQQALADLVTEFGHDILSSDGTLDRGALRTIAFANHHNKAKLDAITHPAIRQRTITEIEQADSDYCVVVVPLLSEESPFLSIMKRVISVVADRQTKIERVKTRSNLSAEEIEKIMQTQLSDEQRLVFSDDIIENNSDKQYVRDEVEKLHTYYLTLSNSR